MHIFIYKLQADIVFLLSGVEKPLTRYLKYITCCLIIWTPKGDYQYTVYQLCLVAQNVKIPSSWCSKSRCKNMHPDEIQLNSEAWQRQREKETCKDREIRSKQQMCEGKVKLWPCPPGGTAEKTEQIPPCLHPKVINGSKQALIRCSTRVISSVR